MGDWGVILAAGLGARMGSPKAFLSLGGKPMVLHSLLAFEKASCVSGIVLVCRKEDVDPARNLGRDIAKLKKVVIGGKERQDSVVEGIRNLPESAGVVAVHDAARPLVTPELIDAVIAAAREKGSAIAAVASRDTVKRVEENRVRETLPREALWCAQTPQAFRLDLFKKALAKAAEDRFYGTDCASAVERTGIPVFVVEGALENIKVTTQSDLLMAEALLKRAES